MNEKHGAGSSKERFCICADPENCTERVPGYRCKKDFMPKAQVSTGQLIEAASHADWDQVVFNLGPPCFHYESERKSFCLRAKRWEGHKLTEYPGHVFVTLEDLLRKVTPSETCDDAATLTELAGTLRVIADRDEKRGLPTMGLENAAREIEWSARRGRPALKAAAPQMAMLPNDHHPGPRCSCRDCQRRYPENGHPQV